MEKDRRIKHSFCDICSPAPGCGVDCTVTNGMITDVEGTDGHPAGNGVLCTKGLAIRQYIYRKDRLTTPLRRTGKKGEGKFEPISWEEAFDEIVKNLKQIRERYGASSVAFYSGYNKWYRPFLQRLCYSFGSVNYGSESSTCFNATGMSWKTAVGYESVAPDRKNSGTFLGWGYNPYYSRNLGPAPKNGRKGKARVIIVDPRVTPAVQMEADLHLRLIPGTDGALAHALARELIVNGFVDQEYIDRHVHGYEEYKKYVLQYTAEEAEKITGVPAGKIKEAARIIGENTPLSINQSASAYVHCKNGYQNHRAVQALCALMGSYDVPGGMIPSPDTFAHTHAGFESHVEDFEWENYPKDQPLPVGGDRYPLWEEFVGEMQACELPDAVIRNDPYPLRAMVAHGMNFRMFHNDSEMKKALLQLDFFVDTDLFLTDSAKLADIVLPCRSSVERSELKVYAGGFAQYYEPAIEPFGESRADDEIIFELAKRLEVKDDLLKKGRDACYQYIFAGTSVDIMQFKQDPDRIFKLENIKKTAVFENGYKTPSGKFELLSAIIEQHPGLEPLPVYADSLEDADRKTFPMILVSGGRLPNALHSRLHDVPWLRSLRPEPMADLNPADADALGIEQNDEIRISTEAGSITVKADRSEMILPGTVHMYHGYREADVNSIIPKNNQDPYSGYPGFKCTACRIEKMKAAGTPSWARDHSKADSGLSDKCTGCGACAVACMNQNDIDVENGQEPYRKVTPFAPYGSSACRHCEEPKCMAACPMNCFWKDEKSRLVLYDNAACIGCQACAKACPFDAVTFRKTKEGGFKMEKCDGCHERRQAGLLPACVKNCPMGVLSV